MLGKIVRLAPRPHSGRLLGPSFAEQKRILQRCRGVFSLAPAGSALQSLAHRCRPDQGPVASRERAEIRRDREGKCSRSNRALFQKETSKRFQLSAPRAVNGSVNDLLHKLGCATPWLVILCSRHAAERRRPGREDASRPMQLRRHKHPLDGSARGPYGTAKCGSTGRRRGGNVALAALFLSPAFADAQRRFWEGLDGLQAARARG